MAQVILLDGSIGQELVQRVGDRPTPLWSTRVMQAHPEMVEALHRDYFDAGATVATTNTYPLLLDRLAPEGLEHELQPLGDVAVTSAVRAAKGRGKVAGAVGPLVTSYRPDLCPPPPEAAAQYAEALARLSGRVDILLFETMSSVAQAEGALLAAKDHPHPVWLAVSVRDEDGSRLRSGEPVEALAPLLDRYAPEAVLVNCSPPEAMAPALQAVRTFGRPFGAYANGFTRIAEAFAEKGATVDLLETRQDLTPERYAAYAMDWVAEGATIVGGCCEVGPAHIAELARQLRAAGHEIVQP
jgi:homocysteine S-methyltransferase